MTKCCTFPRYLFNLCPGILTLTVLFILPALTTTPTGNLLPPDASFVRRGVPCSATAADILAVSHVASIVAPAVVVVDVNTGVP